MQIVHMPSCVYDPPKFTVAIISEAEAIDLLKVTGWTPDMIRSSLQRFGYVSSTRPGLGHFVAKGFTPIRGLPLGYLKYLDALKVETKALAHV